MQKKSLFFFSFPRIKITTRLFVAKNNEKNFADNDVSSSTVEVNIYANGQDGKVSSQLIDIQIVGKPVSKGELLHSKRGTFRS
ncbi:hypothetical protein [Prevotella sp. Rep29]|uniref:hypothetical protein n=1 Tax=Prevotella sp. Rep29 TaxID=2691580 RepID=UPI001C6EF8F1|nr:hypothetical protein [Prevotella sp. Rep29]QYR11085.1 hypothetical protein GRF55_08295 [Prevotella sp. Rep29]